MPIEHIKNPSAKHWKCKNTLDPSILPFHQSLPDYAITPLTPLKALAKDLGISQIYIKDEGTRFGLPAFKILGASWAVYRAIAAKLGKPTTTSLNELCNAAEGRGIRIITTSEGNWGRAVARMGRYLGVAVTVYVPRYMDEATREKISSEGAEVILHKGEYDDCLLTCRHVSKEKGALLILDTSFDGYTEIPQWVTDGYSSMLEEVDSQLRAAIDRPATHAIASVGVGSWAHAVVAHYKSKEPTAAVATVEPKTANCLATSLDAGKIVSVKTDVTIMNGMNCGTVSDIAWPYLRDGVDASVTVSEMQAHEAVVYLKAHGVNAGPCGAAPLAALRELKKLNWLGLGSDSVVVLYCTEAARAYKEPTSE
ncbi:gb [Venturia nashicola]|nr:gb [Venturia nashicola]